jgi:AMP nucleosidase
MKTKNEIVSNWLPRYTGTPLEAFGRHILLTNFGHYVERWSTAWKCAVGTVRCPMPPPTASP